MQETIYRTSGGYSLNVDLEGDRGEFFQRLESAARDRQIDHRTFLEMFYSPRNPLLSGVVVTPETMEDPLYHAMLDLLSIKVAHLRGSASSPKIHQDHFTVTQAAAELGVTRGTVQKAIERGAIKAHKVGNRWLIPSNEVESYEVSDRGVKKPRPLYEEQECPIEILIGNRGGVSSTVKKLRKYDSYEKLSGDGDMARVHLNRWHSLAVKFKRKKPHRMEVYFLKASPQKEEKTIEFEGFKATGRFVVVRTIVDPAEGAAAFKGFLPK